MNLSVVLATRNEETNIKACLESIKDIADEIIIFDEYSSDKTKEIAVSMGAKVFLEPHHEIFHITKQKALEEAKGKWILQLDADERVTKELCNEIKKIVKMDINKLEQYNNQCKKDKKYKLFQRHQQLIERRDGKIGDNSGSIVAFYLPRSNYFLGKYLKYGGTYPDGVIRLVKNGCAKFPAKDVHEQIEVKGRVEWLMNDLRHIDSPTFQKYYQRNTRYTQLLADDLEEKGIKKNILNFINYLIVKPISWFLVTQIRHKGVLDGWQGIVFSFFSALRFPRAYIIYIKK